MGGIKKKLEEAEEYSWVRFLKTWMPIVGIPVLGFVYTLYNANLDLRFSSLEAKAAISENFQIVQNQINSDNKAKIAVIEDAMTKGREDRYRQYSDLSAQIKELRQLILDKLK